MMAENNSGANEKSLRPRTLQEYIGQDKTTRTLRLFIDAVKNRGSVSEHILFYGPPGIGKTTLAHVIAHELKGEIKITSGASLQKSGDLASILTNLKNGDILFIDEIHRIPKMVEESLYPVLEDFFLDIIIGKGPSARTMRLPIPKITIIGATTRLALLSGPLRDRFGLILRLNFYEEPEMIQIIERSSKILRIPLSKKASYEIARRARNTPRIANRILKRARDIFEVHKHKVVDEAVLTKLFELLEIDSEGLTNLDMKYLRLLGEKFQNNPVGVNTIALSLAEDQQTIEEFIEPYLLQQGFIKKTSHGRVLTKKALNHMHLDQSSEVEQKKLV